MEIICVDTNLLIKYLRKLDKTETRLYQLAQLYDIKVPAIVAYEFLRGEKDGRPMDEFVQKLLTLTGTLPFDGNCAEKAAQIYQQTKRINRIPESEDLLVAATAMGFGYPLATDNWKHFEGVEGVELV